MASFTGNGCSRSLFPAVHPNRYPTIAVTPASVQRPRATCAIFGLCSSVRDSSGTSQYAAAHESGQHPDDQQVGVDRLGDVERQPVLDRIGAEVLRCREQAERHLQPIEQQGDDEIWIGDCLRPIAHPRLLSLERRQIGDELIDLVGLQERAEGEA